MILPDSHIFTAGDIQTGSTYNGSFTDIGNLVLARSMFYGIATVAQTTDEAGDVGVKFNSIVVDRDNCLTSAPLNVVCTSATYINAEQARFTTLEPHGFLKGDSVNTTGFSLASYNVSNGLVSTIVNSNTFEVTSTLQAFANPWSGTAGTALVIPNNRVTIQTQGWYFLFGGVAFQGNAYGVQQEVGLSVNGVLINTRYEVQQTVNTYYLPYPPQYFYFNVGDVVMLLARANTNSVVTLNVPDDELSSLGLIWVSN